MARKPSADLRTVDMFTGKTKLEEVEAMALDELPEARQAGPRDIVAESEECAVRWLGLDAFHEGDDVKVAVHPKGHAVLLLVRAVRSGSPYSTSTIKLTKKQWKKLVTICKGDGDEHAEHQKERGTQHKRSAQPAIGFADGGDDA